MHQTLQLLIQQCLGQIQQRQQISNFNTSQRRWSTPLLYYIQSSNHSCATVQSSLFLKDGYGVKTAKDITRQQYCVFLISAAHNDVGHHRFFTTNAMSPTLLPHLGRMTSRSEMPSALPLSQKMMTCRPLLNHHFFKQVPSGIIPRTTTTVALKQMSMSARPERLKRKILDPKLGTSTIQKRSSY